MKVTPEEGKKQAKKNWNKLRNYIKEMRSEDNFLVKFLDGQNEIDQENMYGDGKKNGGTFDERPGDKSVA